MKKSVFLIGLILLLTGVSYGQFQAFEASSANLFVNDIARRASETSAANVRKKPSRAFKRRKTRNFAGRWKGVLYQPGNVSWQKYYFRMTLYQKGKNVSGFSRIAIAESPEYYGVMRLRGTIRRNRISFRETGVVREKMEADSSWCIKSGNLKLVYQNGRPTLRGNWRGQKGCEPGTIFLKKVSGR